MPLLCTNFYMNVRTASSRVWIFQNLQKAVVVGLIIEHLCNISCISFGGSFFLRMIPLIQRNRQWMSAVLWNVHVQSLYTKYFINHYKVLWHNEKNISTNCRLFRDWFLFFQCCHTVSSMNVWVTWSIMVIGTFSLYVYFFTLPCYRILDGICACANLYGT